MDRLPAPPLPDWLERQLPFERFLVRVEQHWIHVMTSGQGVPVVMLHGNPTWGYLYRKVALALTAAPVQVIMPDLVGLGFSSKPQQLSVHQLDHHARWISLLLDALGLGPVVLVIQDWGGPIGLRAMADQPQRLAGLVVLNTVLSPPRQGFKPTAFHRFSQAPLLSDL
ncbi:MAG: alpha/beta fold hydrolase, partial [Myxococcota bacterium]